MSSNRPSSDNDVRMEEDKGPPPVFPDNWIYLKPVDLVMHAPQTCSTCDSMSTHMLLAMSQHLTSFEKAMEERTRGLSKQLRSAEGKIRELQFEEEELNHKLRALRRENNDLREDLRDRSRGRAMSTVALPPRSGPYDAAHHNNETRRKVQQVREERGSRSYSTVVQSSGPPPPNMSAVRPAVPPQAKAKMVSQTPSSVSTAIPAVPQVSVAQSSNAPISQLSVIQRGKQRRVDSDDDDDDDDDEGTLRRENPDVVASVATSYFGTQWRKWVEMGPNGPGGDAPSNPQLYPQAVEQFLFLDHLMLERMPVISRPTIN